MRKFITVALLLLACFCSAAVNANNYSVKASVDSLAMFIGDQTALRFEVLQDKDLSVQLPILDESMLGELELVERLKSDTVIQEESLLVTHSYLITAFDSTLALVPALPFVCGNDTQYSNPVSLKVVDIPVDTTQMAITPIKDIVEPPFNFHLLYLIIAIVLIVVALTLLIIFVVKRLRKNSSDDEPKAPVDTRTPFEIAEQELELLQAKNLYQKGLIKDYYTELTDILRVFFYNKYKINALESTSDELFTELKNLDVIKNQQDYLNMVKDVLMTSDYVKFAKFIPESRDCENAFDKVSKVVTLDKNISSEEISNEETKA